MQLLFIENREKTWFWAAVANRLEASGFKIAWAVQNPMFSGKLPGEVHLMPFPPTKLADVAWMLDDWPILITERGRDHFQAGHAHYAHYAEQYQTIFDAVRPSLVLGEATLFHELLAVREAQLRKVPYLHPAAERYPQDRLCFFHDITQNAFGGSGDRYSEDDARDFARRISEGRVQLSYMRPRGGLSLIWRKLEWAATRGRVLLGRFIGERYNTPSFVHKWRMGQSVQTRLLEWQQLARVPEQGEKFLLYPMQMAPEANIDIWGRPFHSQINVIADILAAAPADVKVAVKCNPKPKYELSADLMAFVKVHPRIILLPTDMAMNDAMAEAIGAITVCGTVGFEAVFGRGRCVSLRHPVITECCPSLSAATPQEAVIKLLSDPSAGIGSPDLAVTLLQKIYARSYPGFVSDPFSSPECLDPQNVELVAAAVMQISAKINHYPLP